MAINYNPADAAACWPAGDYQAVLIKVEARTSKAGNEMEVWTWEVYGPSGQTQTIKDYVTVPACTWKISQLAKALNRGDDFKAGTFQAEDYLQSSVTIELSVEEQDGFDDQNRVKRYKPKATGQQQAAAPARTAPAQAATRPAARPPQGTRITAPAGQPGPHKELTEDDIPF
jgi:hypothetical protein